MASGNFFKERGSMIVWQTHSDSLPAKQNKVNLSNMSLVSGLMSSFKLKYVLIKFNNLEPKSQRGSVDDIIYSHNIKESLTLN